ncbi:TPA: autotransporter outer membrane beta-barrel domain-containing protein [Salmonella enterica subsp. enterica serovar Muenchen]|nr:autotransporter outer membrane beta-barrel domain-containing protein [Salmonella enterica subsp. enterica serovar Muenchen]HEC7519779.1 autotransporter outer membrane beta-barrel domain-containing protein [Salmonella enterica subsp. enterica serovar Muenchen]HEC7582282.1 autotransporter outer membrane beta-barrel domain-containing protein [Salmonella enterica subsp. enterica serovar Muenchen]HEC8717172.1 autotransporter outer membrane beta-barrel domain-containing protein [Salmonella enterica
MAVENKFKLNVIAASVLMGLSLSAVAAVEAPKTPATETTPTKPEVKTLAGLTPPESAAKVSVTVKDFNGGAATTLEKILDDKTEGSVANLRKSYTDAKGVYDKLSSAQQKIITGLNNAASNKNKATQVWNDFGNKLSAADSVYTENLNSLYGKGKNAFKVVTGGNINTDASKVDDSTFGHFLAAHDELKNKMKTLSDGIVTLLTAGAHDGASKINLLNEAKIVAYSDYLSKYAAVKTAELKADSVRNVVFEHIADVLSAADADVNAHTTANPTKENLSAFKDKFEAWNKNKTAENEKTVADAFSTLVTSVSGLSGNPVSDVTWENLASAWSSAADELKTAKSGLETAGTKDGLNGAITTFNGVHANLLNGQTLKDSDVPADFNDALAKLDAAYKAMLNDSAFAPDITGHGSLAELIANAQGATSTLDGLKTEYLAKVSSVNEAGAARLNLLLNELPDQQQALYKAQDDYLKAMNNLNGKTADAKAAKDAYDALYGADGQSGALGNLLTSLKNTSEGYDKTLTEAESTYKSIAGNKDKTQAEKNTALYELIGTQKALASEKLAVDTERLALLQKGAPADISSIVGNKFKSLETLKADLADAAAKKTQAKADYTGAVKDYLDAEKAYQTSQSEADAAKLATAQAHLMTVVGIKSPADISNLYVDPRNTEKGFKQFDKLATVTADNSDVISKYDSALGALNGVGNDIQQARKAVVEGMNKLADLMPLSTPDEQTAYRTAYNAALNKVGVAATTADVQSQAPGAGKVTHILGSLSKDEIAKFDVNSGDYNSVIINVDGKGSATGVKDSFAAKDLYTGTQDTPFTTTVLDIRALELGNGKLADTNTITVGEAGSKATPVEVWAKTAGVKHSTKDENSKYESAENGPAVILSGNLRTATAQLDENGKPMDGQVVRGADQIHLQNVNIHNSFTLADKVQMLKDDMEALNKEAADKIALGQPATGVNDWLKNQSGLLNSKYDALNLTGLQIATTTVNPEFELTGDNAGMFVNNVATVAPNAANILLDNLNITLQNDSVGGISTAINLSGTGNYILANGGVFDAGGVTGDGAQANVLNITDAGANNRIDFNDSVLKGDIRFGAAGNTVNLTNGSLLTGDAIADKNNLRLNLENSTWNGRTGKGNLNVSLNNNSVWNVAGYSSINSLKLNGNNSLNLVNSEGNAQLGGHGFVGSKYGVTLNVGTDLTSDGKGVTSVLAGTYSPDSLHSLTGTGLADNYQFGTLHVNGLATGGKYALSVESAGAEPYTIGGRLADGADGTSAHAFVSYKTSESRVVTGQDGKPVSQNVTSDADFTSLSAPAELGVYQYAAEKVMDGVNNRTNIYYRSTGQLSNSAATVVSLAAAPVDVANLESDTLAKHMNSVRHGKDSGVWVSYFGGENRNSTASGPEYKLKTNGVMLGADTLTENNWLAGVAVSSARSDMSVMNSSGDLNSYGAQFYMSRRYDSGVFVDSALQFNHFSNTAKARMINGQQAKADFSGNSYGLEAKVGYAWNSEGFFAEPYVRAAARAFDGEHYALSNGMTVNSNDYKSMLGEVGADLGYQYAISGGYVKPYLHLAALNEFADGNSVRVNNVTLDDSVKGAAFQAGLGAEVKVTDNLGGYAAFDYTKGDNTERPWQATVGVNYTW